MLKQAFRSLSPTFQRVQMVNSVHVAHSRLPKSGLQCRLPMDGAGLWAITARRSRPLNAITGTGMGHWLNKTLVARPNILINGASQTQPA